MRNLLLNLFFLLIISILFMNFSIFICGALGLSFLLIAIGKDDNTLKNIFPIFILISFILMFFLYYGYIIKYGVPYYIGGSDDRFFEQKAAAVIFKNYFTYGEVYQDLEFKYNVAAGFIFILSWLMRLCNLFGGYHTIAFRVLNIYLWMTLCVLVYSYQRDNTSCSPQQCKILFCLLFIFPHAQYITLHVFRDTICSLLIFSLFYTWDLLLKRKHRFIPIIVFSLIATYMLYIIRTQNLFFVVFIFLLSIFFTNKHMSLRYSISLLFLCISGIIAIEQLHLFDKLIDISSQYTKYYQSNNFNLSNQIFSLPLFPFGIFMRYLYAIIYPLPVGILKIGDIFNDIDILFGVLISYGTLLQILFIPYIFINFKSVDKLTIIFNLLLVSVASTTFTFRHFIMIYPFMALVIVRTFFSSSRIMRLNLFVFMIFLVFILGVVYYVLK